MASRKDNRGRVLRAGESYNEVKGLYVYSYTDPLGRRRYIYSKDLAKLRQREEELRRDQLDGIDSYSAATMDLNQMFDRYIQTKSNLRVSTKSRYLANYNRYVRNDFGKKKLNSIKYSDIIFFYKTLMEERGIAIGTIRHVQRVIRPVLEMAVRDEIIRINPANGVVAQLRNCNIGGDVYQRHALTLEQQRAFLKYINMEPLYMRLVPLFTFMVGTGCRVGEVISLRWEDVDFDSRTVSINHSFFYFSGKLNTSASRWVVNQPKTEAGVRSIPLVEEVYEVLKAEKARQDKYGDYCLSEVEGMSGFVFFNKERAIFEPQNINRQLDRIIFNHNALEMKLAEREDREPVLLPHFTCHILRHTFCARLCEADVNIKVIQTVMGHTDIQTTLDIYAEISGEKKKKTLDDIYDQMKLF